MKFKALPWALVLLCFVPYFALAEESPHVLTGDGWLKMFQEEKTDYVVSAIRDYKEEGIDVGRPPAFYVYTLTTLIAGNTELETKDIKDIFESAVYQNEPEARAAMDRLKAGAKIKKIEMH